MKSLVIDDVRDLGPEHEYARTYEEGLSKLVPGIDTLYLDHDLGHPEKTGYDIAKLILEKPELAPYRIVIVSANPVGVKNILFVLQKAGYHRTYTESLPTLLRERL